LARSVRQVAGPAVPSSSSQRANASASAPTRNGHERRFSLRRRGDVAKTAPGIRWLRRGALAGAAAAVIGFLLFG
ncbi:MAG: hypothetical protein LBS30_02950, partial [Planctomycetota bacterium]|nr:hypothetical protein [Planctomycetota bacterium]